MYMFPIKRAPAGERAGADGPHGRLAYLVLNADCQARRLTCMPMPDAYWLHTLVLLCRSPDRTRGARLRRRSSTGNRWRAGLTLWNGAVPRLPGHLRRLLALQPGAPGRGPARGGQHPALHTQPPGPVRAPAALRHLAGGRAPHRGGDSPSDRESWWEVDRCLCTSCALHHRIALERLVHPVHCGSGWS